MRLCLSKEGDMNTLTDTAQLIMDVFLENGVQKNHHLSLFELFYEKSHWQKYHQDNFTKAIHKLVNLGLIKWGEAYALILTEEGYKALSRSDKDKEGTLECYEVR